MIRPTLIACAAALLTSGSAHAAVGKLLFTVGKVEIERAGQVLPARRGTEIEVGDTVMTGATGMTQIRYADGALMALRQSSTIKIEDFQLPKAMPVAAGPAMLVSARPAGAPKAETGGGGRNVLRLVRGAFRTVTGLIGKGQGDDYRIVTPAATIGIRGTELTAAHGDDGTWLGVTEGEAYLQNDAGEESVQQGEYAHARDSTTPPQQEIAPPEALEQPIAEDEESEDEEDAEAPPAEGEAPAESSEEGGESSGESGGSESASGETGTDSSASAGDAGTSGDSGADEGTADWSGGTTTASTSSPEPELAPATGSSTTSPSPTTTETAAPPPPPPPPTVYNPPVTQPATPAHYAYAYTAERGADTTGIDKDANGKVTGFLREANVLIGSASQANSGADAATGLRWGRWSGGTATRGTSSINLATQSLHWIYATPQAPVIPVSGTADFQLVGNTDPTDSSGNRGFLGSATLQVNFTTGAVTSELDIGINSQVWQATSVSGLRSGNTLFGGTYDVTVSNAAGSPIGTGSGNFQGFLSGTGAGLGYGLTSGSVTVTGVAAFEQVPQQGQVQ